MSHLSLITHQDLKACKDTVKSLRSLAYTDAVIGQRVEKFLKVSYIFAPREIIHFLDRLLAGKSIQSFSPAIVTAPTRPYKRKASEIYTQDAPDELGGLDGLIIEDE